jgi:phospholipid/cholesterol/gamma-HCH transport system permease protein
MVVENIGKRSTDFISELGDYTRFLGQILYWMFRGPGKFARKQLMLQAYEIGTLSMPVVMVTGGFIGMVLAIEMYGEFRAFGLESRIGSVINISVVKQIGPVLTAVMLAGRVGGALTAELGTMKVTEQLDALRAMASNPIRILATPRVMACLMMMPALTIASDLLGIGGGYFMSVGVLHVDAGDYWVYALRSLDLYTIFTGLLKSMFFGLAISSIGCYKGFHCGSGAQGVGRACTESFVASFVTILVMNFFLAKMLNDAYDLIWPNTGNFFG